MNINIELITTVITIIGSVLVGIAYQDRRMEKRIDILTKDRDKDSRECPHGVLES